MDRPQHADKMERGLLKAGFSEVYFARAIDRPGDAYWVDGRFCAAGGRKFSVHVGVGAAETRVGKLVGDMAGAMARKLKEMSDAQA